MKRFLFGTLLLIAGFFALHFQLNDGFSIKAITPVHSLAGPGASPPVLCESYTYLKKGSQSFSFESEDHTHVIKFVRHSRFRTPPILDIAPLPTFLAKIHQERKQRKLEALKVLLQSHKIAAAHLRHESGLLYMHMGRTDHIQKMITLYDKLHRPHTVDLDTVDFVIQQKATLVYPYIAQLMADQNILEGRRALTQIHDLLHTRLSLGIKDHNRRLPKNMGFAGDRPIFLDLGEFSFDPDLTHIKNVQRNFDFHTHHLHTWLRRHYPILLGNP